MTRFLLVLLTFSASTLKADPLVGFYKQDIGDVLQQNTDRLERDQNANRRAKIAIGTIGVGGGIVVGGISIKKNRKMKSVLGLGGLVVAIKGWIDADQVSKERPSIESGFKAIHTQLSQTASFKDLASKLDAAGGSLSFERLKTDLIDDLLNGEDPYRSVRMRCQQFDTRRTDERSQPELKEKFPAVGLEGCEEAVKQSLLNPDGGEHRHVPAASTSTEIGQGGDTH